MSVTLRPATVVDLPRVLALWREADAEPTHTDDLASLHHLVAHDAEALIVAADDDLLVGSVIAGWDGWRGSIYRLVVAPDRRRHGLALALLATAEQRLDGLGAHRSQAVVVETDDRATGFWRASGWAEQTERLRFVRG